MTNNQKRSNEKELEKLAIITRTIVIAIATGLIGFLGGWIFEGRIVLSLIVFGFLFLGCIIAWISSYVFSKRINVLSIMDEDIKKGNYENAVKFGISVSRALHLSGRNWERFKISEKVCEALKGMPSEKEITIGDKVEKVSFLRAKMLIDDCGWSLYSISPFNYKNRAVNKIMGGIQLCVRMEHSTEVRDKVYETTFKGLRHLFGMVIENFDREEKDKLANRQELLEQYIKDSQAYGELLGYLLGDTRMYDEREKTKYQELFNYVSFSSDPNGGFLENLKKWAQKKLIDDKKFRQSTFYFRAKYFYSIFKANKMKDALRNESRAEVLEACWNNAKEMALKLALGYAKDDNDLHCLYGTFYCEDIEKYKDVKFASPDNERFVKAYLLLGKIAMVSENPSKFLDAKELFIKTTELSRGKRLVTYISAQKNIIAVNERLLNNVLNYSEIDNQTKREEVFKVLKEMEDIQIQCSQVAPEGFLDSEMKKSCKRRKKRYKKLISEYKN